MMQARDPVVFNRVTTVAGTQKGEGFQATVSRAAADLSYSESICVAFGMKM